MKCKLHSEQIDDELCLPSKIQNRRCSAVSAENDKEMIEKVKENNKCEKEKVSEVKGERERERRRIGREREGGFGEGVEEGLDFALGLLCPVKNPTNIYLFIVTF